MQSNIELDRRKVLGTIGGLAVAGSGFAALTGGATASAGGSIEDPETATSDDGRIEYVAVQTTGRLTWDGFDTAAKHGRIIVDVELMQDGDVVWTGNIHDTGTFALDESWGGDGEDIHLAGDNEPGQEGYIASDVDWGICQRNRENNYNDGYGLPENPAPTNRFTAHEDGSSEQTKVVLKSEYRLYDADGNELTGKSGYPDRPRAQSSFVVTVENEKSTAGFGDADGEGDTEDSAEVGV